MGYTETQQSISSFFDINQEYMQIPNTTMCIRTFSFKSVQYPCINVKTTSSLENIFSSTPDFEINENNDFRYSIFFPKDATYSKAILLLHGLNERNWNKYLAWAKVLCEQTQKPVILFPISFHMNRSPKEWSNPRAMSRYVEKRKELTSNSLTSSFANLALSERLTENPLRFFTSGKQSANDLITLLTDLKEGKHLNFTVHTSVDFFSYSIGAFLSQVLFLSNPDNLLADSKLFMFCGGAVFSEMVGSSKLIMDEQAFERLHHYYQYDIDNNDAIIIDNQCDMKSKMLYKSFLSMLSFEKLKQYRAHAFKHLIHRINVVTLLKDKVIPTSSILKTLELDSKSKNANIVDFPYEYSHEIPFPIYCDKNKSSLVDQCFDSVFNRASTFLA